MVPVLRRNAKYARNVIAWQVTTVKATVQTKKLSQKSASREREPFNPFVLRTSKDFLIDSRLLSLPNHVLR